MEQRRLRIDGPRVMQIPWFGGECTRYRGHNVAIAQLAIYHSSCGVTIICVELERATMSPFLEAEAQ